MKWIRERREELGLTLDDLAARLQLEGFNYTSGSVGHWERGVRQPPLGKATFVDALSNALKLPKDEIMRLSGYKLSSDHSSAGARAAAIVDDLDDETQELALKLLEVLAVKKR